MGETGGRLHNKGTKSGIPPRGEEGSEESRFRRGKKVPGKKKPSGLRGRAVLVGETRKKKENQKTVGRTKQGGNLR